MKNDYPDCRLWSVYSKKTIRKQNLTHITKRSSKSCFIFRNCSTRFSMVTITKYRTPTRTPNPKVYGRHTKEYKRQQYRYIVTHWLLQYRWICSIKRQYFINISYYLLFTFTHIFIGIVLIFLNLAKNVQLKRLKWFFRLYLCYILTYLLNYLLFLVFIYVLIFL